MLLRREYIPYERHYKPRLVYFLPHFHCGLYCRAVTITDNLCIKQENSSILVPFMTKSSFKSRAGYNGACVGKQNPYVITVFSASPSLLSYTENNLVDPGTMEKAI